MFSIFKRGKSDNESPEIPINQTIEINGDLIIVYENDQFKGSVNINIIDQIIFEHHGFYENNLSNCWLSLRSKGTEMLSVSTLAYNYIKLDSKLIQLTGFNATNYRGLLNYDKPINDVTIFRREIKDYNEQIVGNDVFFVDESAFERKISVESSEENTLATESETIIKTTENTEVTNKFKDFEQKFGGFDDMSFDTLMSSDFSVNQTPKEINIDEYIIVDDRDTLITWKSYKNIDRKYFTRELTQGDDGKYAYVYKIEFITIFNDVKLPYLQTTSMFASTEENLNEKFPINEYSCEIYSSYVIDEFNKLTKKINAFFNKTGETFSTDSRLPVYFLRVNSVCIDIKTTQTSIQLRIIKDIDEAAFYSKDYFRDLDLEHIDYIKIPIRLNILADYKNTSKLMYTPKCFEDIIKNDETCIFWIHKDGSKIGIANSRLGLTFKPMKLIKIRLVVETIRDIEANNNIEIINKDGKNFKKLSVSNPTAFAKYLPELTNLLKIPFTLYKHEKR
jgi:hypothetical protein